MRRSILMVRKLPLAPRRLDAGWSSSEKMVSQGRLKPVDAFTTGACTEATGLWAFEVPLADPEEDSSFDASVNANASTQRVSRAFSLLAV